MGREAGESEQGGEYGDGVGNVAEEGGGVERTAGGGVVFWNVAGLRGKDREFWKNLGKWEVVVKWC